MGFLFLATQSSAGARSGRAVPTREALPILVLLADAVELCSAQLGRAPHPSPPNPDRRAVDERQNRGVLGHPAGRGVDRYRLDDLAAAEAAVQAYAGSYNLHRLLGELDWRTPAERFDRTPFSDRGIEHVPTQPRGRDEYHDPASLADRMVTTTSKPERSVLDGESAGATSSRYPGVKVEAAGNKPVVSSHRDD